MSPRAKKNPRTCVICGARVRNINQKAETCRPLCTRARDAGRTLAEQQQYEIDKASWGPKK